MLLKCCTQYVSKFGKLSSSHRTGKGQSSSQFPRRAGPKIVQNIRQLHSLPMLPRLRSKSFNLGFSSMWTKNFQMYKLDLEKAEKPQINLHWIMEKAGEFQKNIYAKAFDHVDHNKLWEILKEVGVPDHLICLPRNLYTGQEATVRTGHGATDWFKIGKGVWQG